MPWAMWTIGVVAYAVAVFQRGSLAVSGLEFQHRFHAGAADLSMLAVLQLGVYAAMQVPVAFLIQYGLWAFGLSQVLRLRALLRRRRVEQGIIIQPLPRAVAQRFGRRRAGLRSPIQ